LRVICSCIGATMGIRAWRMSRIVLGAHVILPTLWSVAGADEFRRQPGKNWAAPVPFVNWTGFYVGGHTGYARGAASDRVTDPFPTGKALGAMFGGVQIGYNRVLPSALVSKAIFRFRTS
jgi:opacity protein-like surface antigen